MAGSEPQDLPLLYPRRFQTWLYTASHRRLVLRSHPVDASGESMEAVFSDVLAMKLQSSYATLTISELPELPERSGSAGSAESARLSSGLAEIDDFIEIPERHAGRYLKLMVSDGLHEGFVVCAAVHVYAGIWSTDTDPTTDSSIERRIVASSRGKGTTAE